ncbi:C40 family peptidase [Peptoniphilus sp. MSJ-1]|uniref:C40 family peptidase n=1 Tax=Peptoniphilus ovalis TaxID=2841503 RepID=A0ABS6FH32_9FIRM|nr:C40 family peptidase [Peptoniphilus ovalis]MBU5669281.1 C40 family peptidase [Peptoniphilus ovalis]
MDKKLKKDFQKKIIRNRDAPQKNVDSKLVHSDDYTNKIIKTKDRFKDKIADKESKLIHERVKTSSEKKEKLMDFQKSKNKERIKKEVSESKNKVNEDLSETKAESVLENIENDGFNKNEELDYDYRKVDFNRNLKRSSDNDKLTTEDTNPNVEPLSNKKSKSKRQIQKNFQDKITHSKDRFQDKISQKESKMLHTSEDKPIETKKSKRRYRKEKQIEIKNDENGIKSNDLKSKGLKDYQKSLYKKSIEVKENTTLKANETDFKKDNQDSAIEERFSENLKEEKDISSKESLAQKNINKKKTYYKRKNYESEALTRKKIKDLRKEVKADDVKDFIKDKKILELDKKRKKIKDKTLKVNVKDKLESGILLSRAKSSELVRDYLKEGSDNSGVESGEKLANLSSKLNHGIRKYKLNKKKKSIKKLSNLDKKIKKRKTKLEFRSGLEELRKKEDYKKKSFFKKFYQRKQMKSMIAKKHETRLVDKVKKAILSLGKASKELIIRKGKAVLFVVIGLGLAISIFVGGGSVGMSGLSNSVNSVMTTTYLSQDTVLSEVNQEFSSMEYDLQSQIESVKTSHPGYDEYIINKEGEIGHNTHELLSYITSRCGEVKSASEVKGILKELFDKMYKLDFKEEIEIRTRTVARTRYDSRGNPYTSYEKEEYEYKKLIVTLKKKEMDEVVREIFKDYPDNVVHYEALLEAKGNMGDVFGSGNGDLGEIVDNPNFGNPGLAFDSATAKALFNEAEKHIGKRYVFGASGPSNFDCSGFVCWSFTKSGVKRMPRTTAWRIYKDYCNPVSPSEAKPGDIIFFHSTYNSGTPISHVGIYAGNGMMIHAGDPIQYTSINSKYWKSHFYGFGRPR